MIMQLALRPYATAGVAVVGASLIYVTPVVAPNIEQRAVELAAAGDIIDLVSPIDAVVSTLTGAGRSALASVTDALTSGGGALSLGDLSGTLADGLPSMAASGSVDFWQQLWLQFYDAVIPIVGPIELFGGILLGALVGEAESFFQTIYDEIVSAFGGAVAPAMTEALDPGAAEGLGTGLQGVYDAALAGVIDPALPAGVSTALGDITPLFSDAAGLLDPTTLVQNLTTALDPSALTSILDPSAIAGLGTVLEPAGIADLGTLLDTSLIPDIDGILMSLIP
jgi:hypothetical protein